MLKKWKNFYIGIWDTAGQEKYSRISTYYCKGSQAAILTYDMTNRKSFEDLSKFVSFLKEAEKDCYMVVVATKYDLVMDNPHLQIVTDEEGRLFAKKYGAAFFVTSSKLGSNVPAVFDAIGYHCLAEKLADINMLNNILDSSQSNLSSQQRPRRFTFPCCPVQ